MLTRKQIWRRTQFKKRTRQQIQQKDEIDEKSILPPAVEQPVEVVAPKLKSILSSSNMSGMRQKEPHNVRFSSTVHVLLIPSRFEILSHCLSVYFVAEDYQEFKREAVQEIRDVAKRYNIPVKAAMNFLYQSNYHLPPESTPEVDLRGEDRDSPPISICNRGDLSSEQDCSTIDHDKFVEAMRFLESELKFITNAKTDVELNALPTTGASPMSSSATASPRVRRVPSRTTASGSLPVKQHAWAVQWKKQSQ